MNLYQEKKDSYFNNPRKDLISLLPKKKGLKILEIGAGGGDTLIEIKSRKMADEVIGIELFELKGSNQDNPLIDRMIIANIEIDEIDISLNYFDVILCGDVLEHLHNPWETVNKLSGYLSSGGSLIISVPNFGHYSVFYKLFVKKDFKYKERGLFDKTHLRFFCKNNIKDLATTDNLIDVKIYSNINITHCKTSVLNKLTLGLFQSLLTSQYLAVSFKK